MKILFLTDSHLTARGPRSRSDNYVEALFTKLNEIKQVIQDDNIEMVIHGGDMFDKPVVSMQLTGAIAELIDSTDIPWYVVPGNHDLFGYNLKSLPQTSLGLLAKAGVIRILDRSSGPLVITENGKSLSFEGQEYHMDIDKREPETDYHVVGSADHNVLIPHSMLLPHTYFDGVPHTVVSDLKDKTEADLILIGHYHDGYTDAVTHSNGKTTNVYNPGSMMRDEGSKGNLTRIPKYIVMDWSPLQSTLDVDMRDFKSAVPGTTIFDRTVVETKQVKNRYLESFEQSLNETQVTAVDVRTVLDEIIDNSTTLSDETIDLSRTQLEEAEKSINEAGANMTGYIEKATSITIQTVSIKGFQSHEDTVIDFEEGLNAIVGPSDSGKTAIIRALRFALYNEPRGSDFIRQSSNQVSVKISFSDGSSLERKRTQTSAGSYIIGNPDGTTEEIKGFSNQIPSNVPTTHQMPALQLSKDLLIPLNVGYQLDPPFMIGESPGTRAAVIGRLTGADLVDTAIRESNRSILSATKELKLLEATCKEVEEELLNYVDLDKEKCRIDQLHVMNQELQVSQARVQKLQSYEQEIEEIGIEEGILTRKLSRLPQVERLAPKMKQLEQTYVLHSKIEGLSNSLQSVEAEADKQQASLPTVNIPKLKETYQKVSELHRFTSQVQELFTALTQVTIQENEMQKKLERTPIDSSQLATLILLNNKRTNLQSLSDEYQLLTASMTSTQAEIESKELAIQQKKEEYQEKLRQLGVCPLCNQNTSSKGEQAIEHYSH